MTILRTTMTPNPCPWGALPSRSRSRRAGSDARGARLGGAIAAPISRRRDLEAVAQAHRLWSRVRISKGVRLPFRLHFPPRERASVHPPGSWISKSVQLLLSVLSPGAGSRSQSCRASPCKLNAMKHRVRTRLDLHGVQPPSIVSRRALEAVAQVLPSRRVYPSVASGSPSTQDLQGVRVPLQFVRLSYAAATRSRLDLHRRLGGCGSAESRV